MLNLNKYQNHGLRIQLRALKYERRRTKAQATDDNEKENKMLKKKDRVDPHLKSLLQCLPLCKNPDRRKYISCKRSNKKPTNTNSKSEHSKPPEISREIPTLQVSGITRTHLGPGGG
jgi:hypothetical protein